MDSAGRLINISFSELIDRLSILQLKQLLLKQNDESFEKQMLQIEKDIEITMNKSGCNFSARLIGLIIALSQINLHIWNKKEKMMQAPDAFNKQLKLSHQLNGLRNQLKNAILEESGAKEKQLVKTNTDTEDLTGWELSILKNGSGSNLNSADAIKEKRFYNYLLTDLIDSMSINQIKEIFFEGPKKENIINESAKIAIDVNETLKIKSIYPAASFISHLVLLAQCNLHVWLTKDLMQSAKERYDELLEYAQDLNGIRNQVRNRMMALLGEDSTCNQRTTFLSMDKGKWYYPVVKRIGLALERQNQPTGTISLNDIMANFGIEENELDQKCHEILREKDLRYRMADGSERDAVIKKIIMRLASEDYWVSGKDKKHVWEKGWSENLEEFKASENIMDLMPKYLDGKGVLRLGGQYVVPESKMFEFDIIDIYRRCVFKKYLSEVESIYEFGCGSCQHIPVLMDLFPEKNVHGLDWAESSIKIIDRLSDHEGWNVKGHLFNLFEPDKDFNLDDNAGIFTIGAMEQLGTEFGPFLDFIIQKKPKIVFHIESMAELYDQEELFDYIAFVYDKKRNYLQGYIQRLQELERSNVIEIIETRKVHFGSMYHDSYSLAVWKPL